MKKGKFSVVIVIWNNLKNLKQCFSTLANQTLMPDEFIIVDNASTDGSAEYLEKNYPFLKIIRNKKNIGVDSAFIISFNHTKNNLIFHLNNDIKVEKNYFKKRYNEIIKDKNIFAAGSMIIDVNNMAFHKKYPNKIHTINPVCYRIYYDFKGKRPKTPFAVGGGTLIYRKDLIRKPLFDPDYIIYGEDIYLCWKARLRGYKICMTGAKVYHYHIFKKSQHMKNSFHTEKNRILNILLFYSNRSLIKIFPLLIFSLILHNIITIKKIHINIVGYFWILFNIKKVIKKRKAIQKLRRIDTDDGKIFKHMTYKLFDDLLIKNIFFKKITYFINRLTRGYLRFVGIRTIEDYQ